LKKKFKLIPNAILNLNFQKRKKVKLTVSFEVKALKMLELCEIGHFGEPFEMQE